MLYNFNKCMEVEVKEGQGLDEHMSLLMISIAFWIIHKQIATDAAFIHSSSTLHPVLL